MEAVVAQEHPVPVRLVPLTVEVFLVGRGDVDGPTQLSERLGQPRRDGGRLLTG